MLYITFAYAARVSRAGSFLEAPIIFTLCRQRTASDKHIKPAEIFTTNYEHKIHWQTILWECSFM